MEYSILTPLTLIIAPFLIAGFFIETFIFWMFTGKTGVGFWKSVVAVFTANATTAFMLFFISFNTNNETNLLWYSIAFALSVFVEWIVFIPFFYTKETHGFKLLLISFIANLITFILTGFFLFYKDGLLDKYLTLFGII